MLKEGSQQKPLFVCNQYGHGMDCCRCRDPEVFFARLPIGHLRLLRLQASMFQEGTALSEFVAHTAKIWQIHKKSFSSETNCGAFQGSFHILAGLCFSSYSYLCVYWVEYCVTEARLVKLHGWWCWPQLSYSCCGCGCCCCCRWCCCCW